MEENLKDKFVQETVDKIKAKFIGKKIEAIYIKDHPFLDDEFFETDERIGRAIFWSKNATFDVELFVDTKIALKIDEYYFYEEDKDLRYQNSGLKIYTSKKKEEKLLDVSSYFSKNVINKIIKNIYAEGYGIIFTLENDYNFIIKPEGENYLTLNELKIKKRNEIDYRKLEKEYYFEKYSILQEYVNKIKPLFIGKKIKEIKRLGMIYEYNYYKETGISLEFDEPVDIQAGENHLCINFIEESEVFFGINLFDFTETSFFYYEQWRTLAPVYKNTIGAVIKDIIVTKRDASGYNDDEVRLRHSDDLESIILLLDNNYTLELTNAHDYTEINEYKPE